MGNHSTLHFDTFTLFRGLIFNTAVKNTTVLTISNFGLEAEQKLNDSMALSAHISHSIAQGDIKQQASADDIQGSLDQTYAGVHFKLSF